jgi:hypothetical protein
MTSYQIVDAPTWEALENRVRDIVEAPNSTIKWLPCGGPVFAWKYIGPAIEYTWVQALYRP